MEERCSLCLKVLFHKSCSHGLRWDFGCCLEFGDYPGAMLEQALLVQRRSIAGPVLPQLPEYLEPPFSQTPQSGSVAHALIAFALIIGLSPRALLTAAISPQVHGMAQKPVTGPANARPVNLPALVAHRADSRLAAQRVGVRKHLAYSAQLTQQAWCELLTSARQAAEDVMVGVLTEGLLDALAVFIQLGLEGLQDTHQADSQKAFGRRDSGTGWQRISRGKDLQAFGRSARAPQALSMKKLFPSSFTGTLEHCWSGELANQGQAGGWVQSSKASRAAG